MFSITSKSEHVVAENEMQDFANAFLNYARGIYFGNQALLVSLKGDLGAGKTSLSKMIGKLLGVEEQVTSPTFVIQKTYVTKDQVFKKMVHIDAYRIEDEREIVQLGIYKTLQEQNTLVLLEWPEKIPEVALKSNITLEFSVSSENTRTITVV